jgi:hypothetical protein
MIPPSLQTDFDLNGEPDTACLANFRLSRWDERGRGARRIPNAAGATGRVARPVKYGGYNEKPWRGALFHRARRKMLGDDGKLKVPNTADRKFEEVVQSAQDAAVLVLVY